MNLLLILFLSLSFYQKDLYLSEVKAQRVSHGLNKDLIETKFFKNVVLEELDKTYLIYPANQLSKESINKEQRNTLSKTLVQRSNLILNLVSQLTSEQIKFTYLQDDGSSVHDLKDGTFLIDGGLCTASTLLFARTYIDFKNEEAPETLDHFLDIAIRSTVPVKDGENPKLAVTQAAMNMIKRSHPFIEVNSYPFRLEKMKALLAFQNLKVLKSSPQYFTSYIHTRIVSEWINSFDEGLYVFRMVRTADNEKGELFGHTLLFIKEKEISFFFDPNLGCVAFFPEDDPALFLSNHIFSEGYDGFRSLGLKGIITFYKIDTL